jgi:hypothetical protein
MSYYFKCEGLTKPQIIKAAEQLAEREGLGLECGLVSFLDSDLPLIIMIDSFNEVGVYELNDKNTEGKKELKVTIKRLTVEQANKELERLGWSLRIAHFDEYGFLITTNIERLSPELIIELASVAKRLIS